MCPHCLSHLDSSQVASGWSGRAKVGDPGTHLVRLALICDPHRTNIRRVHRSVLDSSKRRGHTTQTAQSCWRSPARVVGAIGEGVGGDDDLGWGNRRLGVAKLRTTHSTVAHIARALVASPRVEVG
jgi:hypothetical protein